MVKTRMQLLADGAAGQLAYKGYRDAIARIYKEEGLRGFWKGLSASYWGCSEGCIQFVVYEKLKKQLVERCVLPISYFNPSHACGAKQESKESLSISSQGTK